MRTGTVLTMVMVVACGMAFAGGNLKIEKMSGWSVVVADDAIPSEKYAAEEFKSLFKESTGLDLPIVSAPPKTRGNVFIGTSEAMKKSPVGFCVDELGDEGLRILIKKGNIAIVGGCPRGTLYGVYEFFEKYLGVRFLTCDHTYYPERASVKPLPCGDYSYVPPFSFRWSFYKENSDNPAFAARMRTNTVSHDEKLGGVTPQSLINHSVYKWINPQTYGQSHPEYFAMVDGVRKLDVGGGGPEPCVTNPEVIEKVAEGVIKELDANPNQRNISVSQNDNAEYCRCPKCEEVNQREGTPMGSHLAFVNAVAERVEKKHPNVKIGTLAYWYTRKAPKTIVPRKNMQIQLCSIECCTFHAIDDPNCPKNREFCADMAAWKAISDDIWVWNYNTNFSCYDMPFPNLRSIGANVRFFLNNNVKGVFMQANGNGNSGEMCELRNYVISNCLWHPGQESWPLVEEFCKLHYGNAGEPVLAYLTMLHDNAAEKGVHPTCFPSAKDVGLDQDVARKAFDCFHEALKRAESDVVRARVEKASICAYKAMILAGGGRWSYENGTCRRDWPEQYKGVCDRYVELCQKYNLSMANEGTPASQYIDQLKRTNQLSAVRIENETWRITVLPGENGKMVEMFHKPSGRNLLPGMTHEDILRGTHEEIGLAGYDSGETPAFDAKVDGTTVRLTKKLEDGSMVERTIKLDPADPQRIHFRSSITHRGKKPAIYQFKAHPEFDAASTSDNADIVSAYILDKGEYRLFNQCWQMEKGPDDSVLRSARGGGLAFFSDQAGFGVLVKYDPRRIEKPYLWWHPPFAQVNLELFSRRASLKNGQKLELHYTFEHLDSPPK